MPTFVCTCPANSQPFTQNIIEAETAEDAAERFECLHGADLKGSVITTYRLPDPADPPAPPES